MFQHKPDALVLQHEPARRLSLTCKLAPGLDPVFSYSHVLVLSFHGQHHVDVILGLALLTDKWLVSNCNKDHQEL